MDFVLPTLATADSALSAGSSSGGLVLQHSIDGLTEAVRRIQTNGTYNYSNADTRAVIAASFRSKTDNKFVYSIFMGASPGFMRFTCVATGWLVNVPFDLSAYMQSTGVEFSNKSNGNSSRTLVVKRPMTHTATGTE